MFPFNIWSTRDTDACGHERPLTNPTGTVYSTPWDGHRSDGQNLHLKNTGTLVGTYTLWNSSKPQPSLTDDTDWVQDTGITFTNPAGAASKMMDDASNTKARWKRVKYVHTSGTGVLSGYVTVPSLD